MTIHQLLNGKVIPTIHKFINKFIFFFIDVLLCQQGYRKHSLLREILPIIGAELRLQRLFSEYQQQLTSSTEGSS